MNLIFDTETTGLNEPEVIEAAWLQINFVNPVGVISQAYGRFKPSKPIENAAMSVHHIMDEDLSSCPPSSSFSLPNKVEYLIGHNIDFDATVAKVPDSVKRICTLAMARHVWPDLSGYSQGALTYHLDRKNARERLKNAHNALADVRLCLDIFSAIVAAKNLKTIEEVYEFSQEARIPAGKMTFGKHRGVEISQLPVDYIRWFLGQPDVNQYLRIALERSLKNREVAVELS